MLPSVIVRCRDLVLLSYVCVAPVKYSRIHAEYVFIERQHHRRVTSFSTWRPVKV